MNRSATKWESITAEEYFKIFNGSELKPYSSYTNPDGNDGLTSQPQMLTTWGDEERELIKSIARRDKDFEPNTWDWDYEYWKAVEWEETD